VASKFDLSSATLINCGVLFLASLAMFAWTIKGHSSKIPRFETWYLIPGLLGIFLVAGIPWAISQWGSSTVFVGLIASQMASSLLWDVFAEGKTLQWNQISGVLLGTLGFIFINLKR
jgi:transporter family-2 protein